MQLTQIEVDRHVQTIRSACQGIGTDERAIISVLSVLSPIQMRQVSDAYNQQCGKSLMSELVSETGGQFGELCEDLLMCGDGEFDAHCLYKAMVGFGTNEAAIIDVLVGRTSYETNIMAQAYQMMYKKDLRSSLKKELSGNFEVFALKLLEGRNEQMLANPNDDVLALYKAGEKKIGTDEKTFINIICGRPTNHLRNVFDLYNKQYHKDIITVIKSEFSGDLERGLVATARSVIDNIGRIAASLNAAMRGLGTNDKMLRRIIVRNRSPQIMPQIKAAYKANYGKTLNAEIISETSGDYQRLLLAIIGP